MIGARRGAPRRAELAETSPRLKPLAAAVGLALGLGAATPAMAATYIVTNLNDSGPGSLRDAVDQANTTLGVPDVINFAPGVTGTIPLATPIGNADHLTINGPGAGLLTITPPPTDIALENVGKVAISNVTFAGGSGGPAAILNFGYFGYVSEGVLTLESCVFSGNSGIAAGAVINILGAVNISNSTFNNNTATGDGSSPGVAGALASVAGTLRIANSTFSGNQGSFAGAVLSAVDTFVMADSTISGNTGDEVGGIFFYNYGAYYLSPVRHWTLSGNVVNHGPRAIGTISSTFSSALTAIRNSTLSGHVRTNNRSFRALISYYGSSVPPDVHNSTLSGNVAAFGPGAIGMVAYYPNALNLTSTIAANSTSGSGTIDIDTGGAPVTVNATNSLIMNGAGVVNGTNIGNIFGVDPLLGPLQNNGGPTRTHALLPGSPAIDRGSNPLALATDQRGAGYARTSGVATDMGAYEVQIARPIPALSEWGTVALAALLGGITLLTGLGRRRRDG